MMVGCSHNAISKVVIVMMRTRLKLNYSEVQGFDQNVCYPNLNFASLPANLCIRKPASSGVTSYLMVKSMENGEK